MSKRRNATSVGWQSMTLNDVVEVQNTAIRPVDGETYTYLGLENIAQQTGDILAAPQTKGREIRSTKYVFNATHVLYGKLRPNLNKVALPTFDGVCSTDILPLAPKPNVLREYIAFYLRTPGFVAWATNASTGTKMPRIGVTRFLSAPIPVPPLPVQERIVEILTKADDIRRKRQQAMERAAKILPAQFVEMFGDPLDNSRGYPMCHLRDLCTSRSGGTPSKKNKEFWTNGTIPWVSPEDMKKPVIFDVEDKVTEVAIGNREPIQPNSVLVVVRGMILQHTVPVALVGAPLTFNQDMKALLPHEDIPGEFLFWALKCSSERLLHLVDTASHGTKKIDTDRLLNLRMIRPQASAMQHFARIHRQYFEGADRRHFLSTDSRRLFDALLSDAFTGELTAEWEQANADPIERSQQLQENLPRLALLAILAAATQRGRTAILVTSLMKYVFPLQMETNGRRGLYQFVPYHYGPFARKLYADLERLQKQGLITVDNDAEEDKTRITTADPQRIEEVLGELPQGLREDVCAILDEYGELDHNRLLKTVYKKYPAYAKNSRLRKKATKKAAKRSRRPK